MSYNGGVLVFPKKDRGRGIGWLKIALLALGLAIVLSSIFYVHHAGKEISLGEADVAMPGLNPSHSSYLHEAPRGDLHELWSTRLEAKITGSCAVAAGRVFVACSNGFVYCLELETGRPLWRMDVKAELASMPTLFEGGVLVATLDGRVVCLGGEGRLLWEVEAGGSILSSPLPAGKNVYFASRDGFLYCVDAKSGSERWRFQADAPLEVSPCLYESQIICASYEGTLFALDAESGRLLWSSHLQGVPLCFPVADEGRVFQVTDYALYCADAQSGKIIWSLELGPTSISNPAVRGNQVVILQGGEDGISTVISLDARTGDRLWNAYCEAGSGWTNVLVTNQDLYLAGPGRVLALEWETGVPTLRADVEGVLPSTLTVTGNRVLIGTARRKVFCLGE
ncbi:MAG: outer membrane protein assembly factor BamB family protein [Actinomycetota bacterium]